MVTKQTKHLISKTDSKAPLRMWVNNQSNATIFPDFNPLACEELINNDPVARGALIHFVDKVVEGDWAILNRKDRTYDQETEDKLLFEQNFEVEILAKIARSGKLYNSAFVENIKLTDGSLKQLNVLDSWSIEVITAPNGDPISYKSKVPNPLTGQYATWTKDEITWYKFGDRTLGYPPIDMRALWENLLIKDYIKRLVSWLWKTGQYRVVYNFESADPKVVDDFIAYNAKNDSDYTKPFLSKGKMEVKLLRDMREQGDLVKMLEYLDGQTLIDMRIPPIDAGIPDASGRSNSDAQSNNLNTHVTSVKKVMSGTTNSDLFNKIGLKDKMIVFSQNDRMQEKMVIDNVNIMKNMGMKEELIREYLTDKGMVFKTKELFEPLPDPMIGGIGKKDINTMPSRFPGEGAEKKKVGTGEASSTRSDQLIKKTITFPEPQVHPKEEWVI
jgi:hypothetical protein